MDGQFLEKYYETVILPQYTTEDFSAGISWKDHGKVGLDAWAHYFDDKDGREFVVLYEDFPGDEYLSDGLTHDIVLCHGEVCVQVATTPNTTIDNVVGYFTLYKERRPNLIEPRLPIN